MLGTGAAFVDPDRAQSGILVTLDNGRNYLFDCGAGITRNMVRANVSPADVSAVFLTHLHFDHCGGCVQWNSDKTGYEIAFKNATFWSNKDHWNWATTPNRREHASFLTEHILPIEASGHLNHISVPDSDILHGSELGFDVFFANGHTDKQMIPMITYKGETICFMADLLPTVGHLSVPFIMGYDTRPLLTLDEKERFLKLAADQNYYLLLEHDAHNELITVKHTEKGVRLNAVHRFNNLF